MENTDHLSGLSEVVVADEERGDRGSIFRVEPSELIKGAIATTLVVVVRVLLTLLKLEPKVPEPLKGALSAEQFTNAIAGALWLAILLVIVWLNKWHVRRKHVHGKAESGKVAIWIAELEGDGKKGEHRTNIIRTLKRELGESVQILRAGIELQTDEAGNETDEASAANRKAQHYFVRHKGDLLIWGKVLAGPPVFVELRFTSPVHDGADAKRFNYDEKFLLAEDFGEELGTALAAVVAERAAPALDGGRYIADVLVPVAEKLARLAYSPPSSMGPDGRGQLFHSFAIVKGASGFQRGDTEALEEAVAAFRAALEEYTRERVPMAWAAAQSNLGVTLRVLGERESGTARLEEAVAACRDALEAFTGEGVPMAWAAAQDNLGNALQTLGDRESGTARLEEAVAAFRAALQERTRARVPLAWASTQNNLGGALSALGARESGTARLDEAVAACRAALQERTRERVPLAWAATQNNLGMALWRLGELESGTARLKEAVVAYRASLEIYTREQAAGYWAMAQNNLGKALRALGERESGTAHLEEALKVTNQAWNVYREAGVFQYDPAFESRLKAIEDLIALRHSA